MRLGRARTCGQLSRCYIEDFLDDAQRYLMTCGHDFQPGTVSSARWTCTRCGAPQRDAPSVHLCPGAQHGDDYAAMLCDCCHDCTQWCRGSNAEL